MSKPSKRVRTQNLTIDLEEYAIIVHYLTDFLDANENVLDTQGPSSKTVRLPKDFVASEIVDLSQEVVERCKYLNEGRLEEVQQLMRELLNTKQMQHQMQHAISSSVSNTPISTGTPNSIGIHSGMSTGISLSSAGMQNMQAGGNMHMQNMQHTQMQHTNAMVGVNNMQQSGGGMQNNSMMSSMMKNNNTGVGGESAPSSAKERPYSASRSRGGKSITTNNNNNNIAAALQMHGNTQHHQSVGLSLYQMLPQASWDNLEEYSDLLYEDKMSLKIKGAKSILRVCLEVGNLELLAQNESLLGVLSRELRENYKRSTELATSICCIFLCFSTFSAFHPLLSQFQCGDACMRILEYESKRYQVRKAEEMVDRNNSPQWRLQLLKQNKLLHTCLHILMNVAEETTIEKKMVNRGLVQFLVHLLDREMEELIFVVLTFLKKLSIFEENKDSMQKNEIVPKLVNLAHHSTPYIALLALRVLYNLSFDEGVRSSLAESGELFQKLVDMLREPPFRQIVLKLLYQFTRDDRCKSLLTYHQDCLVMLLQLIIHFPDNKVGKDLVALSVNLATHARAAELMVISQLKGKEGQVEFLWPQVVLRIIRTRDPMLCRVLRYVISHHNVRDIMLKVLASDQVRMSVWIDEILKVGQESIDDPDLLVEIMGMFANLLPTNSFGIPWHNLIVQGGLLDLLHRLLIPGFSEDDLLLECIMVVSNVALDDEAARELAGQPKFLLVLQDLLHEKREDEEIMVQLLYCFQCLALQDEIRDIIQDRLTSYVVDLMRKNGVVLLNNTSPGASALRKQAAATLQTIGDLIGNQMNNTIDGNTMMQIDGTNTNNTIIDNNRTPQKRGSNPWKDQIKSLRFEVHNATWINSTNEDSPNDWDDTPSHIQWETTNTLAERDWMNTLS